METNEKKIVTEKVNEISTKSKLTFWGFIKKHPTFTTIIVALLSIGAVILYKDASHAKWQKEITEKASNQLFNTQEDLIKNIKNKSTSFLIFSLASDNVFDFVIV